MEFEQIKTVALLRAVVGYLGERDQAGWWSSGFFSADSSPFLAPVFPRTEVLAKSTGVTRAAALVHDERIGVGRVYHLFRLPEEMEQQIHRALHQEDLTASIAEATSTPDRAKEWLNTQGVGAANGGVGPTLLGTIDDFRDGKLWGATATGYSHGLDRGVETYPYFAAAAE